MRQNNKYLEKVYEEMDVYRQHIFDGKELTLKQEDTLQKLEIMRGWLLAGLSDVDTIKLAKTDERIRLQDRRARELLAMTYEIFAELRQLRNREGIKYMYSELFRSVADKVLIDYERLRDSGADPKAAAALLREYRSMIKEAAVIDGAFDTSKIPDEQKKKPTKIVIKRKTVINNGKVEKDELTEEANYEISN
ncbi:hypothetical protein [Dyadobacter diqingensis]|uniref:hypothetical protein n=1 Tax=Dyadobacter diqingensis TaxID=2938121 RepID=UPI0020C35A50|nr:hypothetical protein [Dyadobacter diqingensis]